jgi:hypothetical protein
VFYFINFIRKSFLLTLLPLNLWAAPQECVVCIHGILSPKELLSPAALSFKKEGMEVHNWGYRSTQGTIKEHSERLVRKLNTLAKKEPGHSISFFTHSMGALVLRAALNHPNCPEEAKQGRAVLVGPPNQGSVFARNLNNHSSLKWILGKKAGLELMSTPCNGFENLGPFPEDMKILVIAGTFGLNPLIPFPHDGRVSASETHLTTPHLFTTVKVGHAVLPLSPEVISRAKEFLRYSAQ